MHLNTTYTQPVLHLLPKYQSIGERLLRVLFHIMSKAIRDSHVRTLATAWSRVLRLCLLYPPLILDLMHTNDNALMLTLVNAHCLDCCIAH
jgi:hypothetical protein